MVIPLMLAVLTMTGSDAPSPPYAWIKGAAKSERVYWADITTRALREGSIPAIKDGINKGRQSVSLSTTLEIPDGKTFVLGGMPRPTVNDDREEKSEWSFELTIRPADKGKARLDIMVQQASTHDSEKDHVRIRTVQFRAVKVVPLDKVVEIDLGKDANTGFKFGVTATIKQVK